MPLRFFKLDSTGQPQLTDDGFRAAALIRQLNSAYTDNTDYVLGWFKGIDVEPGSNNVLEFADELQEYAKFNAKKNVWDNTLSIGDYTKWDYYTQESRATASLNIVDNDFIADRAFQIKLSEQDGNLNFIEYYGRHEPESFNYSIVYTNSGQIPPIYPTDSVQQEDLVLAWFKGANLAPTQAALDRYRQRIINYISDTRAVSDIKIDVGIFISK
jgi:hypothetical protein